MTCPPDVTRPSPASTTPSTTNRVPPTTTTAPAKTTTLEGDCYVFSSKSECQSGYECVPLASPSIDFMISDLDPRGLCKPINYSCAIWQVTDKVLICSVYVSDCWICLYYTAFFVRF